MQVAAEASHTARAEERCSANHGPPFRSPLSSHRPPKSSAIVTACSTITSQFALFFTTRVVCIAPPVASRKPLPDRIDYPLSLPTVARIPRPSSHHRIYRPSVHATASRGRKKMGSRKGKGCSSALVTVFACSAQAVVVVVIIPSINRVCPLMIVHHSSESIHRE